MDQAKFFQFLLNLTSDWEVKAVKLNDAEEVDIFIEYRLATALCPITQELCQIYDLREAGDGAT